MGRAAGPRGGSGGVKLFVEPEPDLHWAARDAIAKKKQARSFNGGGGGGGDTGLSSLCASVAAVCSSPL